MPTLCIQCAMKAMVEGKPATYDMAESIEEHMRKYHPDPIAAKKERVDLERRLCIKLAKDEFTEDDYTVGE